MLKFVLLNYFTFLCYL